MDERNLDRAGDGVQQMPEVRRESYRAVVERAFAARESNERLARNFFEESLELLQDHNELNRRTLARLADQAKVRRNAPLEVSGDSSGFYDEFYSAYHHEVDEVTEEPKRGE